MYAFSADPAEKRQSLHPLPARSPTAPSKKLIFGRMASEGSQMEISRIFSVGKPKLRNCEKKADCRISLKSNPARDP